jgi:DNA-binding beta-propeller fold protein YncE
VVARWELPGSPRGVAVGADGTVYAGLATPQAVVAIDPRSGTVLARTVLDSPEIASTKELVTLRIGGERLYIANGSDESATILSLPNLGIIREITLEGEVVRDVIPDPGGRFVYVLGRTLHVFDGEGDMELRSLDVTDPMAVAVSSDGARLAVIAAEDFGGTRATVVALFDPADGFKEISREPLQTDKVIEAALFAGNDRTLIAFARDRLFEKLVASRPWRTVSHGDAATDGPMRTAVGDLVNSNQICLPEGSGPQVAVLAKDGRTLIYAERRCSASGAFSGSQRNVLPASLYGVAAYALAYDASANAVVATDPKGFLTVYHVPRPATAR